MKKHIYIICSLFLLLSCSKEDKLTGSDLDVSKPKLTTLDTWLRDNYTTPYNIEVFYQWDQNKVDLDRYLFPPKLDKVPPAMKAIKAAWLDTYKEVAGEDFIKKIAPREFFLVGGVNLDPSGTVTLGLAEAGKRITFFDIDKLDIKNRASVVRFVSTVQHEYTHIINQTVPFNEEGMRKITATGYTAQWFNSTDAEARELGFITAYARANVIEDFAEMVKTLLSYNNTDYNKILTNIKKEIIDKAINSLKVDKALKALPKNATEAERQLAKRLAPYAVTLTAAEEKAVTLTASSKGDKAIKLIKQKEALIADYFKSNFGIDIYELQRVAAANIEKLLK